MKVNTAHVLQQKNIFLINQPLSGFKFTKGASCNFLSALSNIKVSGSEDHRGGSLRSSSTPQSCRQWHRWKKISGSLFFFSFTFLFFSLKKKGPVQILWHTIIFSRKIKKQRQRRKQFSVHYEEALWQIHARLICVLWLWIPTCPLTLTRLQCALRRLLRGQAEDSAAASPFFQEPQPPSPPAPLHPSQIARAGRRFLASHNAPLRPSPADPGGRRLSIMGFSWALAASGYWLQDVREASERSPGSAYGFISVHSWRLIKLAILLLF